MSDLSTGAIATPSVKNPTATKPTIIVIVVDSKKSMLFSVTFVKFFVTHADVPVAAEVLVKCIEIVIRHPADHLLEQLVVGVKVSGFP